MASGECRLEGWLTKKRGDYHKTKFFHYDSMRWFKLQEVMGTDYTELALCYYKSQRDKEPRGWIFVKDVTELVESENNLTVVSPARTMTVEAPNHTEMTAWVRALVECCPHANVDKVCTAYSSQAKSSDAGSEGQWSKTPSLDFDEYRPLNRDVLTNLNNAGGGVASAKTFDRSTSLFSRNADGDKNSFYFASSGQTQAIASQLPAGGHGREFIGSSDEEEDVLNKKILGEGELMAELADMSSKNSTGRRPSQQHSRNPSTERERDRDSTRATGGYGGGDSSTSNRLHRHIARDTPPRAHNQQSNTLNARRRVDSRLTEVGSDPEDNSQGADNLFNSASSVRAQTGSPTLLNGADRSAQHGGIEVVDVTAQVSRSKAVLRDRQRRNKERNSRQDDDNDSSHSGSDGGSDAGERDISHGRNSSSSSDSDQDYDRAHRTVVASSRHRMNSREGSEDGRQSASGTPSQRVFKGSGGSSSSLKAAVPAPLAAPPRRARDALLAEAAVDGSDSPGSRGRVRESLDEVLRRRPSAEQAATNAEAKVNCGRMGRRGDYNNDSDEEDTEIDFKAEMRRYGGSRDNTSTDCTTHADVKETSTNSSSSAVHPTGPSRPPRPPPPINVKPPYGSSNIYSASAAAVIAAGKNVNNNTLNSIRRGHSTPPRQAGDPGSKVDMNFVEEDWDAEDTAASCASTAGKAEAKQQAEGRDKGKTAYTSSVRADENWLEEDFDDA